MKNLEVRCCCAPQKLLGWLDVQDHEARSGRRITVATMTTFDYHHHHYGPLRDEVLYQFEIATFTDGGPTNCWS